MDWQIPAIALELLSLCVIELAMSDIRWHRKNPLASARLTRDHDELDRLEGR